MLSHVYLHICDSDLRIVYANTRRREGRKKRRASIFPPTKCNQNGCTPSKLELVTKFSLDFLCFFSFLNHCAAQSKCLRLFIAFFLVVFIKAIIGIRASPPSKRNSSLQILYNERFFFSFLFHYNN